MGKEVFIFSLCIFYLALLLVSVSAVTGNVITGDTITGEATSNDVGLTLVLTGSPRLEIITPQNNSYIHNESLPLYFTTGGEQAVWYNLDNGDNITITDSTHFNTTEGGHTLYLFANNTAGNMTSRNVTFTVNLTLFTISFDEFDNGFSGNSTNFLNFSYDDLQNLSGIIFEDTSSGKITFLEAINLTDDSDPSDNLIDIDNYIEISSNRIEIDTEFLPNFNKSATLFLYDLAFTIPQILIDGEVCPSTICTQNSYSGGDLSFNVTHFTVFEVEETPEDEVSQSPPGGGVGGKVIKNFSVNKDKINLNLKPGQTEKEHIIIENNGNTNIRITLENSQLRDFMKINETDFNLNGGESRIVSLDFVIKEDTVPDLYLGSLIIRGGGVEKEIAIALDIESKKSSFDVEIKIPEEFMQVKAGKEIKVNIVLNTIEEMGIVDINLNYIIKDEGNNVIISEQETLEVSTHSPTEFTRNFTIPLEVSSGNYILYTKVIYKGEIASASSWFSVILDEKELSFLKKGKTQIIILIIILILIVPLFIFRKLRKSKMIQIIILILIAPLFIFRKLRKSKTHTLK